ncbi:MAG TPA: type III pantothenate kinase [Chloroflexota bacterium]|nr:type III pantothenate kinase [Chloroflexota bacterium]
MLLAVDVGNTNIVPGVFASDGRLVADWRWATDNARMADEYAALLGWALADAAIARSAISGVVLSSVVPPLTNTFRELARRYLGVEPLVVGAGVRTDVPLCVEAPEEVGADRIANALAVKRLYRVPAIVVDFGTATNFDVVSAAGEFLGGAFAPGIQTGLEGLASRAARLRTIELRAPGQAIGKNTVGCMQAGLVYGYVALVEGLVARIAAELGGPRPLVVATGGLAPLIAAETPAIDVLAPDLTLQGLRLVYELNQEGGGQETGIRGRELGARGQGRGAEQAAVDGASGAQAGGAR